ncbi:MAG: DUF3784 domain-containing protein [Clostridiales bacterium]|nr:DUF3784 domain-containing protein [Clostridiales bacterium]
MDQSLSIFLTVIALVAGVMLLTGHGGVFMKGGNADARKTEFDEKKLEKASGVGMLLIGIASAIDIFTTSSAAKIAYLVVIIVIFVGLILFINFRCKK